MGNLYIIIVLYNPTNEQISHLKKLATAYNIVAIDNSEKTSLSQDEISERVCYIPLMNNCGIAKAQNVGIIKCKELRAKYILFLDQDTKINLDVPNKLLTDFISLEKYSKKIAALGPSVKNIDTNKYYKKGSKTLVKENYLICSSLISSGMLIPVTAFDDIGFMDEYLFIDYVDHEWCWRAASKGYYCYMDLSVNINHKIGKKAISICGLSFIISAPNRYYYQYRNSILLITKKYVPWKWKIKTCIRNIIQPLIILWFCKQPLLSFKYMLKGVLAGIK